MGVYGPQNDMASQVRIEYQGLSAFSVHASTTLVVDPWLEPDWTTKAPTDFTDAEYVLVTHGAHDHLGAAYEIARTANATVITEPAVADHLKARGLASDQLQSMVWGNVFQDDSVSIRALETRHISYFDSENGHVTGTPLGFLIEVDDVSLYYLGDTAIFSDLELFGDLYEPETALVPVGHAPGALAPLSPDEAALATDWLGVDTVVPVHYIPGSDDPVVFREAVADRCEDVTVEEMAVGDTLHLS